jgi:hypothetical protein
MRRYQRWGAFGAPLLLALWLPSLAHSQIAVPDTTPLSFLGVPAGSSLGQLSARLRTLGGGPLRCVRSRKDRSVEECRASFRLAAGSPAIDLWLSAIDSLAGVITFQQSGSTQLDRWRADLEQQYGMVPVQNQGAQRMKQWVRRGRMIRLTWRRESQGTTVSVSLVDGRVLDQWGERQKRAQ